MQNIEILHYNIISKIFQAWIKFKLCLLFTTGYHKQRTQGTEKKRKSLETRNAPQMHIVYKRQKL